MKVDNLSGANLSDANLSHMRGIKFWSFAGFGTVARMTTYIPSLDIVFCGCFKGSLLEFEQKVKQEERVDYIELVKLINALSGKKSPAEQAKANEHPMSKHYGHGHAD